MSFTGLLGVSVIALAAPLVAFAARRLRVPAAVLEIVAGIVAGPSLLGWIHVDAPITDRQRAIRCRIALWMGCLALRRQRRAGAGHTDR